MANQADFFLTKMLLLIQVQGSSSNQRCQALNPNSSVWKAEVLPLPQHRKAPWSTSDSILSKLSSSSSPGSQALSHFLPPQNLLMGDAQDQTWDPAHIKNVLFHWTMAPPHSSTATPRMLSAPVKVKWLSYGCRYSLRCKASLRLQI